MQTANVNSPRITTLDGKKRGAADASSFIFFAIAYAGVKVINLDGADKNVLRKQYTAMGTIPAT
jgi:hypothetical protein